jgi:anti-sigma factor (TIGR02949 family)
VKTDRIDPLTCREAVARLDDYVDRELSETEMERVRQHLETCEACAGHFRVEEQLLRQVREKVRRIAVPAGLLQRIQERLEASH